MKKVQENSKFLLCESLGVRKRNIYILSWFDFLSSVAVVFIIIANLQSPSKLNSSDLFVEEANISSTILSPLACHSLRLSIAYVRNSSLDGPNTPQSFSFFAKGLYFKNIREWETERHKTKIKPRVQLRRVSDRCDGREQCSFR